MTQGIVYVYSNFNALMKSILYCFGHFSESVLCMNKNLYVYIDITVWLSVGLMVKINHQIIHTQKEKQGSINIYTHL